MANRNDTIQEQKPGSADLAANERSMAVPCNAALSLERLTAFIISGSQLTPSEYDHVLGCDECRHVMVIAGIKELQKGAPKAAY